MAELRTQLVVHRKRRDGSIEPFPVWVEQENVLTEALDVSQDSDVVQLVLDVLEIVSDEDWRLVTFWNWWPRVLYPATRFERVRRAI